MIYDRTLRIMLTAFVGLVIASVTGGVVAAIGITEWTMLTFFLVGLVVGGIAVQAFFILMRHRLER